MTYRAEAGIAVPATKLALMFCVTQRPTAAETKCVRLVFTCLRVVVDDSMLMWQPFPLVSRDGDPEGGRQKGKLAYVAALAVERAHRFF